MFIGRSYPASQRGDTIVEVLIAMAVITMVLAGAYVVTNRSLSATRSAQERTIALKLAESQLEQVKALAAASPDNIFGAAAPSPFCISNVGAVVDATNAACAVDTVGAPTTKQPLFRISVARSGNDFVLTETWADVNGRNSDTLQLRYRVYD
jgi:prepilin-type N-terminal cleavage/methylation domain-containing protein